MTKKDYQAIARAIYNSRQLACDITEHRDCVLAPIAALQAQMIQILADDNPRFDRARFIEACETGTTKGMPKRA